MEIAYFMHDIPCRINPRMRENPTVDLAIGFETYFVDFGMCSVIGLGVADFTVDFGFWLILIIIDSWCVHARNVIGIFSLIILELEYHCFCKSLL